MTKEPKHCSFCSKALIEGWLHDSYDKSDGLSLGWKTFTCPDYSERWWYFLTGSDKHDYYRKVGGDWQRRKVLNTVGNDSDYF